MAWRTFCQRTSYPSLRWFHCHYFGSTVLYWSPSCPDPDFTGSKTEKVFSMYPWRNWATSCFGWNAFLVIERETRCDLAGTTALIQQSFPRHVNVHVSQQVNPKRKGMDQPLIVDIQVRCKWNSQYAWTRHRDHQWVRNMSSSVEGAGLVLH